MGLCPAPLSEQQPRRRPVTAGRGMGRPCCWPCKALLGQQPGPPAAPQSPGVVHTELQAEAPALNTTHSPRGQVSAHGASISVSALHRRLSGTPQWTERPDSSRSPAGAEQKMGWQDRGRSAGAELPSCGCPLGSGKEAPQLCVYVCVCVAAYNSANTVATFSFCCDLQPARGTCALAFPPTRGERIWQPQAYLSGSTAETQPSCPPEGSPGAQCPAHLQGGGGRQSVRAPPSQPPPCIGSNAPSVGGAPFQHTQRLPLYQVPVWLVGRAELTF